jgi:hexokinase
VHQALVDIFGEKGKKIVTHHAEDGSGVGSAIIAGEFESCDVRLNMQR